MIALAPLNGASYQRDNARVYGIIKQLVLEGPGRTYILRFDGAADGRSAWLALRDHYEGDGFRNRNVDDAYTLLDKLSYAGEKKGFTFEKFVERHMECFLELARFDEPILESKKVRDFLNRISAPELQASVQQVRATAAFMADFEQAANFISLSVNPIKQQIRNIGSLASEGTGRNSRNSGHNRNQRGGRSQSQGRDGRGGRGGRSRGRGRHQHSRGRNLAGGRLSVGY